jgi:hypothetical protein
MKYCSSVVCGAHKLPAEMIRNTNKCGAHKPQN